MRWLRSLSIRTTQSLKGIGLGLVAAGGATLFVALRLLLGGRDAAGHERAERQRKD